MRIARTMAMKIVRRQTMTRLIDADKLYPDCLTKDGTLAISQSQIANAETFPNRYDEGYAHGYVDGSTGADWKEK